MLVAPQFETESVFDAGEGGEVASGDAVDGVEQCLARCATEAGCVAQAEVVVCEVSAEPSRDCLCQVCFW